MSDVGEREICRDAALIVETPCGHADVSVPEAAIWISARVL
jgi:hypothetical protein